MKRALSILLGGCSFFIMTATVPLQETRWVQVTAETASIRATSSPSGRVVSTVRRGTVLRVTGETGEWLSVAAADRSGAGYVHRRVVADAARPAEQKAAQPSDSVAPPSISHEPLRCVRPKEFPRVAAEIGSPIAVKKTRVYFKARQHPDWYYIDMRAVEGAQYLALLPQPLPETKHVDYYVYALDERIQTTQTDTYDPEVSQGRCAIGKVPSWKGPATVTIGGTKEGQSPVPPGFSKKGIIAFIGVSGAAITGSALTGGGGGVSSTTLALGGGAAAAGVTGLVLANGGESENQPPALSVQMEPSSALVGFTRVSGTASVSDPEGQEVACEWDFGDGSRATGTSVEHIYQQTGSFTVTVTASDASGLSAKSTSTVRVGSLTGLWHCTSLGADDFSGTDYRCVQNGSRFDCQSAQNWWRPTATGSLRQPMNIDLTYRAVPGYLDVACSGYMRADLNRLECWGPPNVNYGMDRIGE
jgi:PKD repeat protein